ncbi:thermonuclease family protein [Leucobacter sp. NPDC058333]|uniref:thermonuclease family protein n=1 Tax=Leucobacter sp. NPDC058333 TaxID=3346450 RepID=UPI0036543E99
MKKRTATRLTKLAVTVAIATVATIFAVQNATQVDTDAQAPEPGTSSPQQVIAVVDGDTINTIDENGTKNRVRIIGINTPEIGRGGVADECYAQDARTALSNLVDGQKVELVTDPSQGDTDKYGRLLRHIHTDSGNIAQLLLEQGAGHEYTYNTPYAGHDDFRAAEAAARDAHIGLWGHCTTR